MTATRKTSTRAAARKKPSKKKSKPTSTSRWSQEVTRNSNALDLDHGVFTRDDPASIARSLKRSAEKSHRKKSTPYRAAMSMLTFYENRAGHTLSAKQRKNLDEAKQELRRLFNK